MRLYLDLRLKLNSFNNGNVEAVFSELRHRGWRSKTTMHKALRELETLGFIALTRQGGIAYMSHVCSLYRFTDQDCYDFPKQGVPACKATHDYKKFTSLSDARAVLRESEMERKRRRQVRQEKSKVQKTNLVRAVPVPIRAAN